MSGIIPTPSRTTRCNADRPRVAVHVPRFITSTAELSVDEAAATSRRFSDTPVGVPAMYAFTPKNARMSAIKGRAKRADNAPTVLLQARVTPDVREEVQAAAAASGVSVAYYLDTFLRELVQMNGALPLVAAPRHQAEELPIPAA